MHEEPAVPHYGEAGKGLRLKEGMSHHDPSLWSIPELWKMKIWIPNGWTAYTRDGGLSCQYEHTIGYY